MKNKITASDEAWDNRELGAEATHIGVCDDSEESAINDMMGLQAISIRLPKALIENFKMIAQYHGVGYQPLMRDILCRFSRSETQKIMQELLEARQEEQQSHSKNNDSAHENEKTNARKCA